MHRRVHLDRGVTEPPGEGLEELRDQGVRRVVGQVEGVEPVAPVAGQSGHRLGKADAGQVFLDFSDPGDGRLQLGFRGVGRPRPPLGVGFHQQQAAALDVGVGDADGKAGQLVARGRAEAGGGPARRRAPPC